MRRTNARTRAHCHVNRSLVMGSTLYIFLPHGALGLLPDDSFQETEETVFRRQKLVFKTT